jgi:hypothetical protein
MSELLNRYESLKDATRLAVSESESLDGVMGDVLTKVVHESIKKYQQRLNVGIEDSVSDLLEAFKHKIAESIFDTASTWQIANKEPVMFPRGCRYAYTRGASTIFVVEQDPGVRNLSFETVRGNPSRRHALAMPYVVFLSHFKGDKLTGLYCGWRRAPLRTLNDQISRPILPNIHENLSVCMSLRMDAHGMSASTEEAISDFWNSTFNNDVSDRWDERAEVSEKLVTHESWQIWSEDNPLFMLELDFGRSRTVQSSIDLLTKHEVEPDADEFRHRLSESIDACVKTLFSKIIRYFKKTKFERHSPKDVTENMKSAIIDATGDLTDIVRCLDQEIASVSISSQKRELKRVGCFWTDYSP